MWRKRAGLSVEPNDVAEGMAAFIEIILKQSGATPEQMQQMVGGMDSGAEAPAQEADMGMGMLFAGALTGGAQAMGQMADQAYARGRRAQAPAIHHGPAQRTTV